jgi:beta-glucosidase/6-phospho-beta-glucosidase/beta-galactosidase
VRDLDRDVWVVENGLCNRVRAGHAFPRSDGWTRDRYLRENLKAVVDAVAAGVPVSGYWHWTLADNYEWGSYEPRFGLFGVEREHTVTVLEHDSMGVDAAAAYRSLIAAMRQGDASAFR